MNPNTEICLRLYLLDYLHVTDKEFRKLYVKTREKHLANFESENSPMKIDVNKIAS